MSSSRFAAAMPRSRLAGSRLNVASSTSTNTGVAPTSATDSAVAENVNAGQNTASPFPTPSAIRMSTSASVPLETPIECFAPQKAERSRSSSRTSGPLTNWQ